MDNSNDIFGYEEMKQAFDESKKEQETNKIEEEYKRLRRESKKEQANAFLESLSSSKSLNPAIEPPMERKTKSEIMGMEAHEEQIDATRRDRILDSLKSEKQDDYEYIVAEEQPRKNVPIEEKKKSKAKEKALAVLVGLGILAAGVLYGEAVHQRDINMMEGMNEYAEFLEESGQKATEENYEYFVEHVYNQDAPEHTSGGRTNG